MGGSWMKWVGGVGGGQWSKPLRRGDGLNVVLYCINLLPKISGTN